MGRGGLSQNITAMSIGGSDQCVIVPAGHHVQQAGGDLTGGIQRDGAQQQGHISIIITRSHQANSSAPTNQSDQKINIRSNTSTMNTSSHT